MLSNHALNYSKSILFILLISSFSCAKKIPEALIETSELQYTNSWEKLNAYPIKRGRTDDLHFFDPQTGFVINSQGYLTYTEDGGESWEIKHENKGTFFRCLTFKNRQQGWLGTIGTDDAYLSSKDTVAMYETKDGGDHWTPVQFNGPTPKGLCGLQKVTDNFIVGCGRVRGPSYFIKTLDGGKTWDSYDYNHLAGSLIAPYFFDEKHGFLIGGTTQDKVNCRSLVLETFDGGMNWDTAYISSQKGEYCWKFSFPTPDTGYISIQRNVRDGRFYHLFTEDGGKTWEEKEHTSDYYYVQGIGFINDQIGWIGGSNNWTYETRNGGASWAKVKDIGRGFNNFKFFGDTLAYGVGFGVFKSTNIQSSLDQDIIENDDNGNTKTITHYKNGYKSGASKNYFPNGNVESFGNYKKNLKHGVWTYSLKEDGSVFEKVKMKNGIAKISKKKLANVAGKYEIEENDFRIVSFENGRLFTQRNDGEKFEILAERVNKFYYPDLNNVKLEFITDSSGAITHSLSYSNGRVEKAIKVE